MLLFETSNFTTELPSFVGPTTGTFAIAGREDELYTIEDLTTDSLGTTGADNAGFAGGAKDLTDVFARFHQMAYLPLSSMGLLGNLVSLWVWQAETTYNCTLLMLKVLAVWDSVYCVGYLTTSSLWLAGQSHVADGRVDRWLSVVVINSQVCSINMTLLSSVTRLVAVFKPLSFNTILSRPRVVALCAAILVWSLLLTSLETSWHLCQMMGEECDGLYDVLSYYRRNYVFDYLAYCTPSLLLLLCNIATVYKVSQQRSSSSVSSQGQGEKTRRLSVTMVMISLTSLVTYPVAVSLRLALNPGQVQNDLCDVSCYFIVVYSCAVLSLFNSSINFVYYCVISTRFRDLLRIRVDRLKRCFCSFVRM